MEYGSHLDFLLSWEKAINEHPDHPILVLKYEDLKEDYPASIRRLAEFLGVTMTDDLVSDIIKATDIDQMKKSFSHLPIVTRILRKGQVGDWKNWLTVAQSELIDEKWGKLLDRTMFKPKYHLN